MTMSDCSFSIDFNGSPSQVIGKARDAITGAGGSFNGDENEGEFSLPLIGNLKGSYSIDSSTLNVNIQKRPMLLSCGRIEKELRRYLDKEL
jgi:hypothetical protein